MDRLGVSAEYNQGGCRLSGGIGYVLVYSPAQFMQP